MTKFPDKKYQIIYADPPWRYKDRTPPQGGCEEHYSTMLLEDIKAMPIQDIADSNCALFMWVTMPLLKEGLEVIEAWGFNYINCAFTWVKQNPKGEGIYLGLGRWTRGNAELCLFAKKGSPKRIDANVKQILLAPRGRHSAKPAEARDRIVALLGDLPRIELFARQSAEGWDNWGNEL